VIPFITSDAEKEGTTEDSGGLDSLKGAAKGRSFLELPLFDKLFTLKDDNVLVTLQGHKQFEK
jgi:hypothetical protein